LKPGTCEIEGTLSGFSDVRQQNLRLDSRQTLRVNVTLAVAGLSEDVKSTASPLSMCAADLKVRTTPNRKRSKPDHEEIHHPRVRRTQLLENRQCFRAVSGVSDKLVGFEAAFRRQWSC
jgi:hypothetical protein